MEIAPTRRPSVTDVEEDVDENDNVSEDGQDDDNNTEDALDDDNVGDNTVVDDAIDEDDTTDSSNTENILSRAQARRQSTIESIFNFWSGPSTPFTDSSNIKIRTAIFFYSI